MTDKLPLDAKIALTAKMVDDLEFYIETKSTRCPTEQHFKVVSRDEDLGVERAARVAALNELNAGIKKVAFDTRRVDQEKDRNPRRNLQHWHRSEDFIDDESKEKIVVFDKLQEVVAELKEQFDTQSEWHDSYVRVLSTNLDRVKLKRAGDSNIEVFKPHLSYLEQLIYNRYRYTLEDIKMASKSEIRERLLSKDEDLKNRGDFLMSTGGFEQSRKTGEVHDSNDKMLSLLEAIVQNQKTETKLADQRRDADMREVIGALNNGQGNNTNPIVFNMDKKSDDSVGALFGSPMRRSGEKSVERTITIKIVDSVVE